MTDGYLYTHLFYSASAQCAISIAVKDALKQQLFILGNVQWGFTAGVVYTPNVRCNLNASTDDAQIVSQFTADFDKAKPVKPFSFSLIVTDDKK